MRQPHRDSSAHMADTSGSYERMPRYKYTPTGNGALLDRTAGTSDCAWTSQALVSEFLEQDGRNDTVDFGDTVASCS